jgi:predicted nucleotidyltransferase
MASPDKNNILKTLSENSGSLARYGVMRIGLFGSRLSNDATEESDIDLLVDIQKDKKTFRNFMSLNYYLEELLHGSPHIGPHILNTVEYASFTG